MCKTLKEINQGSIFPNDWVYEQTRALLAQGKLVGCWAAITVRRSVILKRSQKI